MIANAVWNSSALGCCVDGPTVAAIATSVVVVSADSTSVGLVSAGSRNAVPRTAARTIVRVATGGCAIAVRTIGARAIDG